MYDANDRDDFMKKEWGKRMIYKIYQNANFKVMQADIFRYCVLHSYGGFYCDISIAPLEKLISFLEKEMDCGLIVGEWDPKILINSIAEPLSRRGVYPSYIYNGFIVSRKSSIFMEDLIKEIEERFKGYVNEEKEDPRAEIIMNTGPGLVTELFARNIDKYEHVKLFAVKYSRSDCTIEGSKLRHYTFKSYMDRKNEKLFIEKI
jgi:mannosyltransferase OCH1-like enzyme